MENLATDVMCGDFFDHIEDLLDFPNDDDRDFKAKAKAMAMGGMMPMETAAAAPPYIHSDCGGLLPPPTTFPSPPMDAAAFDQEGDQLFDDLDIADLEWVSNFMDDSASSFNLLDFHAAAEHNKALTLEEESLFRTPSPVSVLESNSLSGGGGFASSTTTTTSSSSSSSSTSNFCYPAGNGGRSLPYFSSVVPARARSKRPRPAARAAHVTTPFLPTSPPEADTFGEAVKKAKKNKNPPLLVPVPVPVSVSVSGEEAEAGPQPQVRKCMHCEIQKTPQWRAGPMGPKTLCNACGVRYKSGRLFPEYRPAASPTFVPSLHSNSHKKVVEMRINATAPNTCDLLEFIRRRE